MFSCCLLKSYWRKTVANLANSPHSECTVKIQNLCLLKQKRNSLDIIYIWKKVVSYLTVSYLFIFLSDTLFPFYSSRQVNVCTISVLKMHRARSNGWTKSRAVFQMHNKEYHSTANCRKEMLSTPHCIRRYFLKCYCWASKPSFHFSHKFS